MDQLRLLSQLPGTLSQKKITIDERLDAKGAQVAILPGGGAGSSNELEARPVERGLIFRALRYDLMQREVISQVVTGLLVISRFETTIGKVSP
jgi:hypothetical protein